MLGQALTRNCNPVDTLVPSNVPRRGPFRHRWCVSSAAPASQPSTYQQRDAHIEGHSLHLTSRQQAQQLVNSQSTRWASANSVHNGSKRLKVAVDVDEGATSGYLKVLVQPLQMTNWSLTCAVLGRFLHSLNEYCEEEHGLHYNISDYDEYNFHKVNSLLLR